MREAVREKNQQEKTRRTKKREKEKKQKQNSSLSYSATNNTLYKTSQVPLNTYVLTTLFACSSGIPLNTASSERFLGRPAVAGTPITSVIVVGRPEEKI